MFAPRRSIPASRSRPSTGRCEEAGILERHDFGDGRSRYETSPEIHHDHLINVESGKVIEFADPELEAMQRRIAERLGFRLVDHRMELYGVPLDRKN
jgi:Fur family ferric uptake transcriptional regulator